MDATLREGRTVDVDALTDVEEMQSVMDDLQAQVDILDNATAVARSKAASTGDYSDSNWYWQSMRLIKRNRRTIQRLAQKISDTRRKSVTEQRFANANAAAVKQVYRQERAKSIEFHFVGIAKQVLPAEMFNDILIMAQIKLDEIEGDGTH